MKEFFSSPDFLWWMLGLSILVVVAAILRRNTVWEARGITPTEDVEKLRLRMMGLVPKSKKAWLIFAGVLAVIVIGFLWKSAGTTGSPSSGTMVTGSPVFEAPSLETVWIATKNYWLWILIALGALYVGLSFLKDKGLADKLQTVLAVLAVALFIGVPVVDRAKDAFTPQVICKDASAHETRSCNLNTAWSTWIKAAEGPAANGMRLCIDPGAKFEREEMNGTTFWHFKVDKGRFPMKYRFFPGDQVCPDVL